MTGDGTLRQSHGKPKTTLKDFCNVGSTWDNTLAAAKGTKIRDKKTNDELIAQMMGNGNNATSSQPTKTRLSKEAEDECVAAVNITMVIPHPTADDHPKCIVCKTAVAQHMLVPNKIVMDKRYEMDFCNACMLVAEAKGKIFLDHPASCGCPADRYSHYLDCKSCYIKRRVKYRTGAVCNHCGDDLGIGTHLLGTTEEWMILSGFSYTKCRSIRESETIGGVPLRAAITGKGRVAVDIVRPMRRKRRVTKQS
jgi:hypothetical protein